MDSDDSFGLKLEEYTARLNESSAMVKTAVGVVSEASFHPIEADQTRRLLRYNIELIPINTMERHKQLAKEATARRRRRRFWRTLVRALVISLAVFMNFQTTKMTSCSLLRQRIMALNQQEREIILSVTQALFNQFRLLSSDEFSLDELTEATNAREIPVNQVVAIVNRYHNEAKTISHIMQEQNLSQFEVIAALCDYAFKQQGTLSRFMDLSQAIEFMGLEQCTVTDLITLMLKDQAVSCRDVITKLVCFPSHCLLALTLIWIELKNPKMANLFEQSWATIQYPKYKDQEFQQLQEQFTKIFNELQLNALADSDFKYLDQLNLETIHEVGEGRSTVIANMRKDLKELDQYINKRPQLEVETVLSDSFESDVEVATQDNDEVCVLIQKVSAKWLQTDLVHDLLPLEIKIEPGNFYFVRSMGVHNENLVMSFTMCELLEGAPEDGSYKVKNISSEVSQVFKCDLAMGKAPSVRCPEGTRVIALYSPDTVNAGGASTSKWFAGTIAVKPMSQNRLQYLIFFDNGMDAYVEPKDIRLLAEQPIDPRNGEFEPRQAHLLVTNPAKANFIKRYLSVFPDWPLIRLKKSKNTMRVLARRGAKEESAFVLDVDRQMCLLRFPNLKPGPAGKTGKECVLLNCREHEHIDEWIYRGNSDRFPTLRGSTTLAEHGVSNSSTRVSRLHRNRSAHFEMALPDYDRNAGGTMGSMLPPQTPLTSQSNARVQTARKSNKRRDELGEGISQVIAIDSNTEERRRMSRKVGAIALKSQNINTPHLNYLFGRTNSEFHAEHDDQTQELNAPDWKNIKYNKHKTCSPACLDQIKNSAVHKKPQYAIHSPYFTPLLYGYTRMMYNLWNIDQIAQYLQSTNTKNLTIDLFSFDVDIRECLLALPASNSHILLDDFANALEDVKIPVVNAVDSQKVPNMNYRERRFAESSDIYDNIQPQFCSGCTCTDNCSDPSKCECQQLTITSNERLSTSLRVDGSKSYKYRTLTDKLISGVYECNDLCHCSKNLCFNRVVQQKIKVPLQLYMTAETGWGVRTLVDLPAGTFICTYSGSLLTDQMAEQQGKLVSDVYFAELDLHEVVEAEKQQQGIDLIDEDEGFASETESPSARSLRVQERQSNSSRNESREEVASEIDEEIAVSMMLPSGSSANRMVDIVVETGPSAQASDFNFEKYFGDNALFIVDAQESGNIGRFLNHSCEPNVFVQMVLVDTHDLRLPWVAFFTETFVKAGEELRWNYNYTPNSVPGKVLLCKCGSTFCQGRLL
uniref:Histone-lysine N-methyltransferase eggless n=1 Tax=Ditylenchus dipsaci TaxID=166011 RepID=A0A915EN98_9BILA